MRGPSNRTLTSVTPLSKKMNRADPWSKSTLGTKQRAPVRLWCAQLQTTAFNLFPFIGVLIVGVTSLTIALESTISSDHLHIANSEKVQSKVARQSHLVSVLFTQTSLQRRTARVLFWKNHSKLDLKRQRPYPSTFSILAFHCLSFFAFQTLPISSMSSVQAFSLAMPRKLSQSRSCCFPFVSLLWINCQGLSPMASISLSAGSQDSVCCPRIFQSFPFGAFSVPR